MSYEHRRAPFEMTATEQKAWEELAQAVTAPDPQQAVQDWAERYKVKLTNQTAVKVTRTGKGGRLSPPVLELSNVMVKRTMVDGILSGLGEEVHPGDPGEPVEQGKKCSDSCADSFDSESKTVHGHGVISVKSHCTFEKCETKKVNGISTIFCYYSCTSTATTTYA